MRVNVGQAKTELSKLLACVEAGEDVEIARNAFRSRAWCGSSRRAGRGAGFLAARGSLAGRISIGDHFEFTEEEIDELLSDPE